MNLRALIAGLDKDFDAVANAALADCTASLAEDVRQALATRPGGPHDHPWLQTGALHDSIEAHAEGASAVVASRSKIALYQEHGSTELPPRPTFGPIAAEKGQAIAHAIAQSVTQALRSL